ncbi:hypothetical protein [Thermovibrio ammonificans]
MKKASLLLLVPALSASCALNPFASKEPQYTPPPVQSQEGVGIEKSKFHGVKNVVYYMKKAFSPVEGEVVLNSYDGYIIDVGREQGVSVGDRFISQSGAVLKVTSVSKEYSTALPTLGKPVIGEKVQRLTFNRALFINFAGKKGLELYRELKKEVPSLNLAPYKEGEAFKEKFHLKYPSDFRRRVPVTQLTGYDGFIVVSDAGAAVYDATKKLIRLFPWEGTPVTSVTLSPGKNYKVVLDFKAHATSLFLKNLDSTPEPELLVTTENDVRVYRLIPNTLTVKEIYRFKNPFRGSYLFHTCPVTVNGQSAFVIDGFFQNSKSVRSGLFTIKQGKLVKLAESDLILSCFDENGDGVNDTVWGQKVSRISDKLFSKKVWKLKVQNGRFVKISRVNVPEGFQVTSAQLFKNHGKQFMAYYDLNYYFNVAQGTKIVWRSPIQIGASPNSLYWYSNDMMVSYYITPKPEPTDVDGDGNEEVYFSQNKNAVPGILRNIYTFDGGRILMLYYGAGGFDWEEATSPIYKLGGIEAFSYSPELDAFVAVFTSVSIFKPPRSKLLIIKPKE